MHPPGGPGVFHTISVCEHVLPRHLAHGDLAGTRADVSEAICRDGDACPVDDLDYSRGTERCLEVRQPTDCEPSPCARESCVENGCVADPVVCTSPDPCTVSTCSEVTGACQETPRVCPAGETCDPTDGSCWPLDCPCEYFSIPQIVEFWGSSVNLGCPTADDPTWLVEVDIIFPGGEAPVDGLPIQAP